MSRPRNYVRDQRRKTFERDGRSNLGDGVTLFRHPRSKYIYADFRFGSQRIRESTGCVEFHSAEIEATRRHKALEVKVKAGQPVSSKGTSVGDIIAGYLEDLVRRFDAGERNLNSEISVVRRNFLPFWYEIPLADLGRQQFYAWERWRKDRNAKEEAVPPYRRGDRVVTVGRRLKSPSPTTLRREKQYFVRALAWAADQPKSQVNDEVVNELRHLPRPRETKKQRVVKDRRDALSPEQVAALIKEFGRVEAAERTRVEKLGEKGLRKNYARRLMALHVRLLLCSGMRPGAEILELTWDRLAETDNGHGEKIVVIDSCGNGKNGPRIVNCDPEALEVLADLRRLLEEFGFATQGCTTLWPSPRGGIVRDMGASFKSTLRRIGLKLAVSSEALYVCRHTYLTERLRKGVSSDILAVNCGTSVEMISRHYNHLQAEDIREALRPPDQRNPLRLKVSKSSLAPAIKLASFHNGQKVVI
jgi:integrase